MVAACALVAGTRVRCCYGATSRRRRGLRRDSGLTRRGRGRLGLA
jgi:hypothetical protein